MTFDCLSQPHSTVEDSSREGFTVKQKLINESFKTGMPLEYMLNNLFRELSKIKNTESLAERGKT